MADRSHRSTILGVVLACGLALTGSVLVLARSRASEVIPVTDIPADFSSSHVPLPAGFVLSELATDFGFAPGMVIAPAGEIFVINKGDGVADGPSSVRLIQDGVVRDEPILTIRTNSLADSGLLSIALDPTFATSGWFYLYYATAERADVENGATFLRLSRFTFDLEDRVAPADSEVVIIDDIPWGEIHHGNALQFDEVGNLLLGLGDRGDKSSAQDDDDWQRGAILRIRPLPEGGYAIPPDNPFIDDPEVSDEVFAIGVRNPFRFARRASDGLTVLSDVGSEHWEEINRLSPGANYGWPIREGPCNAGRYHPCSVPSESFTDPVVAYRHDDSLSVGRSGAVTALAFYEGTDFPDRYRGQLFFADLNRGFLGVADPDKPGDFNVLTARPAVHGITDIVSADGGLYILNIFLGKIYFLGFDGEANQVPVATMTASTSQTTPGTTVRFDGNESADPDGDDLVFNWNFGDGSTEAGSSAFAEHAFEFDGTYDVRLWVTDSDGAISVAAQETISVYSGELPQIELAINGQIATNWQFDDLVEFSVNRSTDNGLGSSPYQWRVEQVHNDHVHPQVGAIEAANGQFRIPEVAHDPNGEVAYRFLLTMRTDSGQEILVSLDLLPAIGQRIGNG